MISDIEEIKKEFEIQRGLKDHPNVVRVFEIIQTKNDIDYLQIVMELCESDLEKYLNEPSKLLKFYSLEMHEIAMSWIPQILHGLKFIHECLIIHRDIKPGKIETLMS